jgi:hypothetical protein
VSPVRYSITKTFDVPISFAYRWCTDFTDDDPKLINAPYTRHVIEKTKSRAIWIQHYSRDGQDREGVRIVILSPPDSWHLESINEELYRTGDYKLTSLDRKRTKLQIKLKTMFHSVEPEFKSKLTQNLADDWEKYKIALMKDYELNPRSKNLGATQATR